MTQEELNEGVILIKAVVSGIHADGSISYPETVSALSEVFFHTQRLLETLQGSSQCK